MEKRRDVFQAIADPTRRDILCLIADEPLNLNSIAENFDISRPAISQHIKVLDESGLVAIRKKGRQRFCYIRPQKIKEIDEWLEQFRQHWEDRFSQLDQVLTNLKDENNEK
ncbi:metalloregulator ArsR/SmtB family transcription factor [Aliifodinibius sp. S!AR15-10]|uniref:ArsR/SmtB family transcription factor n=1 Tax=Aliifodinibius sp. S!AR15-10 TaxID=2950437 RepID=UPI0028583184|nr:metalloregulator ArsR/SmtB family transcription factor [Aliifodinibius sp. S!AR15-10]MDR8391379.1 metalloregulator ArsR/SmtB family transcription factor [Aliifodinibius sp. S!AR15-10]